MKWEYPRKKRLKRTSRKGNEGKEQRRVRNKEHHKSARAMVVIRTGYRSRGTKETNLADEPGRRGEPGSGDRVEGTRNWLMQWR